MTASTIAGTPSADVSSRPEFWELLWRSAGIQSVGLFVIADVLRGHQPQVEASADSLLAFYGGNQTRILVAAAVTGLAVLNLLWFAASVRITLADVGKDGWGAAATWVSDSAWAPDGDYARFVSSSLLAVWVVIVSWILFIRRPAARAGW